MEFRQLIISEKEGLQRYTFSNKVNLVTSTLLSDELLKENINRESSDYVIESLNSISLIDVFQIKVNIQNTGVVMANFEKEKLSEEEKQKLISEISTLKDKVEPTFETQKVKIVNLIDILSKYSPIYVCFANKGDFVFTKSIFEDLLKERELDFPVLMLLPSLNYVYQSVQPKKKVVSRPSSTKKVSDGSKFDWLGSIKCVDFIFFGVFSIFIVFGTLIAGFEIINGDAISIFLVILSIAFVGIHYYAVYKAYKDNDKFIYEKKALVVPVIYIILGIIIGIVLAWVVNSFVLKLKEDVEPNYTLLYGLGISLSSLMAILGLFAPIPISKIVAKIKKN